MKTPPAWSLLVLTVLALAACASGTEPASTRAIEERYLGMGEAQLLYRQGQDMLREGRYREAHAAFFAAESNAYTDDLRAAARVRRMWLEEVIKAYEEGRTPPPPPVVRVSAPHLEGGPLKPIIAPEELPPPAAAPPRDPDGQPILPALGGQPRY
jgi:hypothetical protein